MDDNKRIKILIIKALPLIIATLFISLYMWSWGYWLSPIIDFGRELYVPWQLLSGKNLYEEIAYIHGPFSPYFNAMVFKILGVQIQSIVLANLFVLGLIVLITFKIVESLSDSITGYISITVFLIVFSFNQLNEMASFNFICPYSHEMTHGIVLSLSSMWLFICYFIKKENLIYFISGSFFLGLVFLTKVEMFLAIFISSIFFIGFHFWRKQAVLNEIIKLLLIFLVFSLLPIILFFIYLSFKSGIDWSAYGIIGGWKYLLSDNVVNTYFQTHIMGIANLSTNLYLILKGIFWVVVAFLPVVIFSMLQQKLRIFSTRIFYILSGILILTYCLFLFYFQFVIEWSIIIRTFPFIIFLCIGIYLFTFFNDKSRKKNDKLIVFLYFSIFSFLLLLRILFATRIDHYGFALAFPGAMVIISILFYFIPKWFEKHNIDSLIFRIISIVLVTAFCFYHFQLSKYYYGEKTGIIVTDKGVFYDTPEIANLITNTLQQLRESVQPEENLVVLPEGVIFNYLAGIENPLRQEVFTPPALAMWSEQELINQFKLEKPDYILLIHRTTYDYGKPFFGVDYASDFFQIIKNEYQSKALFGAEPFSSPQFGIQLLKLKNKHLM